jgi:toxin FitB
LKFLLDTNVVSEWVKPRPDRGVITWLAEVDEDRVYLSVVTLAELRYGVQRMPAGTRRSKFDAWLQEELPLRFENRVLPINAAVADRWGELTARSQSFGRTMGVMDGFLAATAEVHGLTMVTRNVDDFSILGEQILNPWSS